MTVEDFAKPDGEEQELLLVLEEYLAAGVHIGTRSGMSHMREFIYRVRNDGLYVLDVRKTDERIRTAAKFLSRYEPSSILVCSVRTYGIHPVKRFAEVIGAQVATGRFVPGTLTNSNIPQFREPEVITLTDPRTDKQAQKEASRVGIPVVALCDTDNITTGVDLVIPCNNKGRNSLACIYWLLARQILREKGELTPEREVKLSLESFRTPRGLSRIQE
ncbi:MAG: 30S ribosomal protein S2 [Candidatus Hodarchaeota archaeon]